MVKYRSNIQIWNLPDIFFKSEDLYQTSFNRFEFYCLLVRDDKVNLTEVIKKLTRPRPESCLYCFRLEPSYSLAEPKEQLTELMPQTSITCQTEKSYKPNHGGWETKSMIVGEGVRHTKDKTISSKGDMKQRASRLSYSLSNQSLTLSRREKTTAWLWNPCQGMVGKVLACYFWWKWSAVVLLLQYT